MKIIKDQSLLFSDFNLAIIVVDSSYVPLNKEGVLFTKVYSSSYGECKRLLEQNEGKPVIYPIGDKKYVCYLEEGSLREDKMNEVISLITRFYSKGRLVSFLTTGNSSLDSRVVKLFTCLDLTVSAYSKVLI